jgi:hypothetical protein
MKTDLMEASLGDSFYINNLAIEARNLQVAIEQQMEMLGVPVNPTELNWGIGLESEEQPEEKKKTILEKLWDFIIVLLKAILNALVKFLTGKDLVAEAKYAKQADDIVKNKAKHNIDFANDVVAQLSPTTLAIICAIEENKNFIKNYNHNIEDDKKIAVSTERLNSITLERFYAVAEGMEQRLIEMGNAVSEATAKGQEACAAVLRKTLEAGLSINGSENAAYLKSFEQAVGREKKYETLTKAAESFKRHYAPEETVALMRKIATILSKQFATEAKVVDSYIKLNRAVIIINNKIYTGK